MVKVRGDVRPIGDGTWRIRVLGKAIETGLTLQHKGETHATVSDVILEKIEDGAWEMQKLTVDPSQKREDVRVHDVGYSWNYVLISRCLKSDNISSFRKIFRSIRSIKWLGL